MLPFSLVFPAPDQVGKPPEVDEGTLTSISVRLQWAPPDDPNGIITIYLINVMALSTDPGTFMMGMSDRRKRQTLGGVNIACILPGEVNVDTNITILNGYTLTRQLNDLSE